MRRGKMKHVFAIPTHENCTDPAINLGTAENADEAIQIVKAAGFAIIPESEGGSYDTYDAEDAPDIYGYEPDGLGAISITVKP
jgi:hypothetical protein